MLERVGAGVIDGLLALGHVVGVLLEADLTVLVGLEDQQVAQEVLVAAVLVADADLQIGAEVPEEGLVLLPVVAHELFQLALDALFEVLADDAQLPVVLQQLTGDVQAQVGGIHHALDEIKIVVHQLVALLHDHDAVGVERDATLIVTGKHVFILLPGDKQHRLIAHRALGVDAHQRNGILAVVVLLLVPGDAVIVGHLALRALPNGNHAVDGLVLRDHLVVILRAAVVVFLAGLEALLVLHVHLDRPAHIVGILAHQRLELPDLQVRAVNLIVRVGLEVHDHIGADGLLVDLGDGVAVRAGALPLHALLLAVFAGEHGNLVGHHEGGIEAHAELTDDAQILGLLLLHLALELIGAGLGDDAQVALGLGQAHPDAVVAHSDGARFFVGDQVDAEIVAVEAHVLVGQGKIAELVDRVGRIGEDLTQEDLFVGVNGIDHQVKESLALGLELFFAHVISCLHIKISVI